MSMKRQCSLATAAPPASITSIVLFHRVCASAPAAPARTRQATAIAVAVETGNRPDAWRVARVM